MVHGHMPGQTNAPTSLAKLAMAVDLIIARTGCLQDDQNERCADYTCLFTLNKHDKGTDAADFTGGRDKILLFSSSHNSCPY